MISAGVTDIFIAKYNTSGTLQWLRRGGGENVDFSNGIVVDGSENVYVTGMFQGTANFNTPSAIGSNELISAGSNDIFIAKYNTSGTLQWLRRGGGTSSLDSGLGIAVDGIGNVYCTGYFDGTANFNTPSAIGSNELISAGSIDIFIAKYNTSGTLQWLRRGGGTSSLDSGLDIAIDASGKVYCTGYFSLTANFNTPSAIGSNELISAGSYDIFIAKYNTSGTLEWLRRGGGTSGDRGVGIATSVLGRVITVGSNSAGADFGASTLSSSGGFVWVLGQ